ncbi:DRTGG domain-containing protein [Paenibacillus tarimensis]|uniref:DRTGG domain-containing protein n=1 Tax=Paenibacillus tarimensis TaxID=416012 RepID=UPI001EEAAF61|nr:DRTGG domain-containing protein [Paenibacillus tarimensis]MCF2943886.1 CBS domain-containing protein [Paenibacillus tarimensis]
MILNHIKELDIGTRISVRGIAKALNVSEGTAYRAVKEAENIGYVSTKERIGTVRIDKKQRGRMDRLTFGDVADIVEGHVLGGVLGLGKSLHKFVIGAMELDDMMTYIDTGSLLIVGNRENAHRKALDEQAGVLITGGFDTSNDIKRLADEKGLPIISSRHDTFTVASMINRAMYDRLIKRKIMLLEDIVTFGNITGVLRLGQTVSDFQHMLQRTGHTRYPVVDEWNRVIGMITAKDVAGSEPGQTVDRLMTRSPITAHPTIPVVSAAHRMMNEGIDLLPIVDKHRKLLAVVSRAEVTRALQFAGKQKQTGETFDDLIWSGFQEVKESDDTLAIYKGRITPQMSGPLGTASEGVLATLLTQASRSLIRELGRRDHVVESMTSYYVRPVQIDSEVTIRPSVLELSRKSAKVEMELHDEHGIVVKGMLSAQMIETS